MQPWQAKLQSVLESWRGTPWVAGCSLRGVGVDCVRFVVAVLDELHGGGVKICKGCGFRFYRNHITECPKCGACGPRSGGLPPHIESPEVPRLPQDMSVHDRMGAFAVAHLIAQRYPHTLVELRPELIESGDVVIVRMGKGGPGHVAIAGGRDRRQLWHAAAGVGVCFTSSSAIGEITRIWRPAGRQQW